MTLVAVSITDRAHHDVAVLCWLLKVSCSGSYAWLVRHSSAWARADDVLTVQIRTAIDDNRKVYRAPRIHAELAGAGVHIGRKRVTRLMRQAQIVDGHRRKRSFSITKQGTGPTRRRTGCASGLGLACACRTGSKVTA